MPVNNENKQEAVASNLSGFIIQVSLELNSGGEVPVFIRLYDDEKNGTMLSDDGGLVKAFLRQSNTTGISFTKSALIEIVGTAAQKMRENLIEKHPDLVFLSMKDDEIKTRVITNTDPSRCLDSREIVVLLSNEFPDDPEADKIKEYVTGKVRGFAQHVLMIWGDVMESSLN